MTDFNYLIEEILLEWSIDGMPETIKEFKKTLQNIGLFQYFNYKNSNIVLRELYEAILAEYVKDFDFDQQDFERIKEIYKNRLVFDIRTSNSAKLGQFSTPLPIAFILTKWFYAEKEHLPHDTKIIDPFAGNGNLLTFFEPDLQIYANELDELRYTVLDKLKPYNTTNFDASKREEYEKRGYLKNFDIVITNPPFFGDRTPQMWENFKITEYDKKLVLLSLELMKDNGKAAIIFNGTPTTLHKQTFWNKYGQYKQGNERNFWFYLHKHYNIVDVLYINGKKMYSKLGQATNVRLVLIDGRKTNPKIIIPPVYNPNYDKLTNSFDELCQRIKQTEAKNLKTMETKAFRLFGDTLEGHYNPQSKGKSLDIDVPDSMDYALHKVMKNLAEKVGDIDEYVRRKLKYKTKEELYKALSAEQIDAVALAIYNIEIENLGIIIADQTGVGKGRVAAAIMRYAKNIGKKPIFLTIRANLFSDIYRDLHAIGCDDLVPIAEPERDEAGNIIVKYKEVIDEETGEITYEEKPARYIKIKNPDIDGAKRFVPFIVNNNVEIKDSKGNIIYESKSKRDLSKIEKYDLDGYDCVLATYSQFNTFKAKLGNVSRQEWLVRIASNNIVIMDESHQAGGEGQTGIFFRWLIPNTKSVVYLSATYAKFPKNMPIYYSKTALRYTGLDDRTFVEQVMQGGTVLQEVISENLVASGSLVRRERPLGDIKFNFIYLDETGEKIYNVPDKEAEHKLFFDKVTGVLRKIIKLQAKYINPYIDELNRLQAVEYTVNKRKRMLGFKSSPIFSKLFQIINQLIFSMKADSVGEIALRRLADGYKPVIVFQNTMESLIKEAVAEAGDKTIEPNITFLLKKILRDSFSLQHEQLTEDGKIEKVRYQLPLAALGKDGEELYYKILDDIETLDIYVDISPIDRIKRIISKAGYKVEEMTGRSIELKPVKGGKAKVQTRKKESLTDIARKFQNNEIDAVLLNESGSTGISLHATTEGTELSKAEVKPRVMIVAQPPLDVNVFVQMLGRINRSGQIYKPEYDILSLAIPAEKRFMAMLHEKLSSLSANTTADQRSGSEMIKSVNFINKYGDQIVIDWLKENRELDEIMDFPLLRKQRFCKDNSNCPTREVAAEHLRNTGTLPMLCCYEINYEDVARRVSGRVAILSIKDQEKFYNKVTEQYEALKEEKRKLGEWDLEIEEKNLDAKILETHVISKGINKNSPFGDDVILEKLDAKILSKPFTKNELVKNISKYFGWKDDKFSEKWLEKLIKHSEVHSEELAQWYNEYMTEKYQKEKQNIIKQTDKEIKKLDERPSLLRYKDKPEKYNQEKQKLIDKIKIEESNKLERLEGKYKATGNRIYKLFKTLKVGFGYLIETGRKITNDKGQAEDEIVNAVFLGFSIKDKYPIPSNITLTFAVANDLKTIKLQPTDSYKEKIDSLLTINSDRYDIETIKNWERLTKSFSASREVIYALSGNTILAKSMIDGQWAKIKYHDGTIKKVVLLNKNVKIDELLTPELPINAIIPILNEYSVFSTDTQKGDITIENGIKINRLQDGIFKVQLPSSNKEAAKFYKNETLCQLTEEDEGFIKEGKGKRWEAHVSYDNMKRFLKTLALEFGVKIKLTRSQYEKIQARAQYSNIDTKNLIYTEAQAIRIPKPVKQKKTA